MECRANILAEASEFEAFFESGIEYLEQYNFCGIRLNKEAEESSETETQMETETEVVIRTEEEAEMGTDVSFVPEQYIMVGDSRFVGMRDAVGEAGCTWICQVSAGLSWFTDTAVPQIDAVVRDKSIIIINMGVNDLGNMMGYVDVLHQKVPEWMEKGALVYYMSVNPVSRHAYITNEDIISFNNALYGQMPAEMGWIESNAYLRENGYYASDGLHYDGATYQSIFNYCMEVISGFYMM